MSSDLYAVVGNPISHSKSPLIHSLFAAQTHQDMEYTAIQAPLDDFAGTVSGFFSRGGKGLNVTVPFKEQAWELVTWRSDRAGPAGAVNTLYRDAEGHLCGDNTDGVGLVRDLTLNHGVPLRNQRVLVLGAGGAVRGILGPLLAEQPAEVVIANRTLTKAQALVDLFAGGVRLSAEGFDSVREPFDLIINGTSASLQGDLPPLDPSLVDESTISYDMMYGFETTVFNRWAEHQGACRSIDGLGMLVEQAAEAFWLWRGVRPDTSKVLSQLRQEGF
ncbi:shikimate dehydrogenase [Mangrovitalea sediminis]|uniref:shikimate dehydrogenase n=1 Tax=Mangrovitalea sediminis TaxID=1982043 RepID=UPI000BE5D341|nr:shikimate dehydrogenase [Mangrovitalea sediminis]